MIYCREKPQYEHGNLVPMDFLFFTVNSTNSCLYIYIDIYLYVYTFFCKKKIQFSLYLFLCVQTNWNLFTEGKKYLGGKI